MQVILPLHGGLVEIPAAVSLGSIDNGLAVRGNGQSLLRLCRMRNLPGGAVFIRGGEHLAAAQQDDLLPVVGHRHLVHASRPYRGWILRAVPGNGHVHLPGFPALGHGVYLTSVSETERTVFRTAEEADRMPLKMGKGRGVFRIVHKGRIHIERPSVALAQEDHPPVTCKDRVPVLPGIGGNTGMCPFLCIIIIDVACHRGCMVLAPDVLAACTVIIQE